MAPLSRYLVAAIILSAWGAAAQSLQLKRADTFTVVTSYGRSVTKLRGNVKLSSSDGVFACDSADWFRAENRFFAYGNVRFTGRSGTTVRARTLEYLNGESYFAGGVSVRDGDQTLQTSSLRYDTKTQRGMFSQRATVATPDGNLTCRRGDFSGGSYRFLGDVRWKGANERLYSETVEYRSAQRSADLPQGGSLATEGDSVVFGRGALVLSGRRSIKLAGGVRGWGATRRFQSVEWSRWPDEDRTTWTGSANLLDWEKDSTELWADQLRITKDSVVARGSAIVRMPSWSGRADRWLGQRKDSTYVLDGDPVIWSGAYQILAQTFHLSQQGPGDSLWAFNGVHLGTQADSMGRCDQMAAEQLRARIRHRKMDLMDLETNAQALFYPDASMSSQMKSARIQLTFLPDGGLDEVRFFPSPNGGAVNDAKPTFLPGYQDRWGERPSSTEAMSGLK
jgi:hypothetical protein